MSFDLLESHLQSTIDRFINNKDDQVKSKDKKKVKDGKNKAVKVKKLKSKLSAVGKLFLYVKALFFMYF
jgi:1,4-dihydroxy-2-naphthoate octaprenyltransferase